MRTEGLIACQPRPFRITTEADGQGAADMPDLVGRNCGTNQQKRARFTTRPRGAGSCVAISGMQGVVSRRGRGRRDSAVSS